jgi:hypothetical protein
MLRKRTGDADGGIRYASAEPGGRPQDRLRTASPLRPVMVESVDRQDHLCRGKKARQRREKTRTQCVVVDDIRRIPQARERRERAVDDRVQMLAGHGGDVAKRHTSVVSMAVGIVPSAIRRDLVTVRRES